MLANESPKVDTSSRELNLEPYVCKWLNEWWLMQFSIVFQIYPRGQCIYPCFPGVLLTSTPHNILSKPLAAFQLNHCRNNGQWWERNESCHNDHHQSLERILDELRIEQVTSCSEVHNATDRAMGLGPYDCKADALPHNHGQHIIVNPLQHNPEFSQPKMRNLLKHSGKKDKMLVNWLSAGHQLFLYFLKSFQPLPKQISTFESHFFCHWKMLWIWTSLKVCHLVKS